MNRKYDDIMILAEIIKLAEKKYGGIHFTMKKKSLKWRAVALFCFWMWRKDEETGKWHNLFLEKYTSAGMKGKKGYEVALPGNCDTPGQFFQENPKYWKVLAHELVHIYDRRRTFLAWFDWSFMSPQIYAIFALVAIGGFWVPQLFIFLLFLGTIFPLPAKGRMKYEMRGYTMNMAVNYWRYGSIQNRTTQWIAKKFTGPDYYFMWPFKRDVERRLDVKARLIRSEHILREDIYLDVREIVDKYHK